MRVEDLIREARIYSGIEPSFPSLKEMAAAAELESALSKAHNRAARVLASALGSFGERPLPGGWRASVPVTANGSTVYIAIGDQFVPRDKLYAIWWGVETGIPDDTKQNLFEQVAQLLAKLQPLLGKFGIAKVSIESGRQMGRIYVERLDESAIRAYIGELDSIAKQFGHWVAADLAKNKTP